MKIFAVIFALAGVLDWGRVAAAQNATLLKPSQLNPSLQGSTRSALDSAFKALVRVTGTNRVTGFAAPARAVRPIYMVDPDTHKKVNAVDVARTIIAIQQLYYKRTGRALEVSKNGPTKINLDQLSSATRTTVTYGSALPIRAAGPTGQVQSAAPARTSIVIPPPLVQLSSAACKQQTHNPDASQDMTDQWNKIVAYRKSTKPDICSLGFANIVEQASKSTPLLSPQSFPFGNPSTAQGLFVITPSIASSAGGAFVASLDSSFNLTILNVKQPTPLIRGTATVTVPSKGNITSDVSVTGAAFSTANLFQTKATYGPSEITYTGNHQKPFELFKVSRSWVIPLAVATTTVTASAAIEGQADLSYDLKADSVGLFGQAKPSLSTTLVNSIGARNAVCDCKVESNLTVQNSCSTEAPRDSKSCNGSNITEIDGLLANISYGGNSYAVERLYTHYAPWDYQATIRAYGHVAVVFWFDNYIMKTDKKPLTQGFTWDSGWQVQRF